MHLLPSDHPRYFQKGGSSFVSSHFSSPTYWVIATFLHFSCWFFLLEFWLYSDFVRLFWFSIYRSIKFLFWVYSDFCRALWIYRSTGHQEFSGLIHLLDLGYVGSIRSICEALWVDFRLLLLTCLLILNYIVCYLLNFSYILYLLLLGFWACVQF